MKRLLFCVVLALYSTTIYSQRVYHVATNGNDRNNGTKSYPLRTISAASQLAQQGETVMVHTGIYRERINPPRGGTSDAKRITYMAAPGEKVVITGAELIKGWKKVQNDTWKVTIPNSFFGKFNPYIDTIHGDWFEPINKRKYHTGSVYLNGDWLIEAAKKKDVMKAIDKSPLWFSEVDTANTTIWAQFKGVDPNQQSVEINARQTVFYPERTGINYITVRGFILRDAATPWAPPTAEQIGLIGTNWSKGWIIENNDISYSKCSGISLGKYGDEWDNKAESAIGYVGTIKRALANGWSKDNIGGHIVRNNSISHCEQAGIVGSLGSAFSTVMDNEIHDIHVLHLFDGAEMAGIKFHGAIDAQIIGNHIHHTNRGIWLDWMAQGARVSSNLLHNNREQDIFFEVNHGPFLADNNFLLSKIAILDLSGGGAIVHNLIAGIIQMVPQSRRTPYMKPHSTKMVGLRNIEGGDMRYYNNIFIVSQWLGTISDDRTKWSGDSELGLGTYENAVLPLKSAGNVYMYGTLEFNIIYGSHMLVTLNADKIRSMQKNQLVTTALLGKAIIPDCWFENPNGNPLVIDTDYLGRKRNKDNPFPGPLELKEKEHTIQIWPADTNRALLL